MRRRALVVDDDETIRRLVRTVLEAAEFDVTEAANAADALASVDTGREAPNVAVLDIMMPEVSGVELCERLDTDTTRVVMLTAVDDPATEERCRAAGAQAFLTKPFSSVELLDLVEGMLT